MTGVAAKWRFEHQMKPAKSSRPKDDLICVINEHSKAASFYQTDGRWEGKTYRKS